MAFTAYERRWVARTPRAALDAPPLRAFEREAALRTFDRVTKRVHWSWDWGKAQLPPIVAPDEAVFWIYAMSAVEIARRRMPYPTPGTLRVLTAHNERMRLAARAELESLDVRRTPSRAEIMVRLAATARPGYGPGSSREVVIPLAALVDLPDVIATIVDEANAEAAAEAIGLEQERRSNARFDSPAVAPVPETPFASLAGLPPHSGFPASERAWLHHALAAGFADYVAPYLSDERFAQARDLVRDAIARAHARPPFVDEAFNRTDLFPPAYYLAASLHLTGDVETIVARIAERPTTAATLPWLRTIVYGLAAPEDIVAASGRFRLELTTPAAVREWLATTGDAGLDEALAQIALRADDDTADAFVDALAASASPSLATAMLRATTTPVLYVPARTWLEANVDRALPVLAAEARGISGLGATANEILRRFARRGDARAASVLDAKQPPR